MSTPSWDSPAPTRRQQAPRRQQQVPGVPLLSRLRRAWEALDAQQRLACAASIGLFLTMFLPWYSESDSVVVGTAAKPALAATETSLNAFQAFSFVEAAVLLTCGAVLAMLFARAEHHPFRLPGGDGTIVALAGGWAALLIFYRLLDKPSLRGTERITATVGVQWGIFFALAAGLLLAYAGTRMRADGAQTSGERPDAPRLRAPDEPATVAVAPERRPTRAMAVERPLLSEGRPPFPPAPAWTSAPARRRPARPRRSGEPEGRPR